MHDRESVFSYRNFLRSNWVLTTLLILLFTTLTPIVRAADIPEAGDGHQHTFGPLQSSGFLFPRENTANGVDKQSFSLFTEKTLDQTTVGAETWHSYPIYGGEMTSIAMDPFDAQTVYVGTRDAGVFKTIDGGQSWQPARTGLTFYPIRSLRIDPQHANTLYAGTDFDGIWKSTDSGNSWFKSSSGFDGQLIVFNIVIDPQNTNIIYAGIAGGLGFAIGNIYKSTDGGATWEEKDNGITHYSETYTGGIFSLAIDPANPLLVYAGTTFYGAFKSSNGGETWIAINNGLPFSTSPDYWEEVNALAIDPHHSNRLSAIIEGKYYIFDNAGWQMVSDDTSTNWFFPDHLYFHPTDPSIIYGVGDYFVKSTDGGINWLAHRTSGSVHLGDVPEIAFHPSSPDTIYAASSTFVGVDYDSYGVENYAGGVYKTVDQGQTWEYAPQGITATPIQSVAIDPRNSGNIYAASGDAFFYGSQDGGLTWSMGYLQTDVGRNYSFCSGPNAIAVDPLDSQNIYVACAGLFRSIDQGKTFNINPVPYPLSIAITPNASSPIYVGTLYGDGIYKSSDDGSTWVQTNQGLPLFGGNIPPILSLAVDPNHPDTVWAGTQFMGGIMKSIDGGEHWSVKGLTQENFVWTIAVRPDNSNEILAGAGYSIYKSTDGGSSWQEKLSGIAYVRSIVFDPRSSSLVYASTEGGPVLRSTDGGETWYDYSNGIFYPVVYALAITPGNSPRLIAGSYGSGLYWIDPSNPPTVTITANDPTATEAGTTTGQFTVSRTGGTTSALTVKYAVSGTATSGSDYTALSGSVTIPAGSAAATITVTPINDTAVEDPETVIATLSADTAYNIGIPSSATVTITIYELPVVTITANDPTATEAPLTTGQFTISRTGGTTLSLTVKYAATGTATSGSDYTALSGSVTIPAGSATATITVTPINDTTVEDPETVIATLSADAAYIIGTPSSATVTITSDDLPVVTITATDPTATEAPLTFGHFTVSRTGSTASWLIVKYAVSGTATPGSDYTAFSATVSIPEGSSSGYISIYPVEDGIAEVDETVVITLTAGSYTIGSPDSATVIITDKEEWATAYRLLFAETDDLQLLRQYRDKFLRPTELGARFVSVLYVHSNEALAVFLKNPELLLQAREIIEKNIDAVGRVLEGGEGIIDNAEEFVSFLDDFADLAPPELSALILEIQDAMLKAKTENRPFLGFVLK